MAMAADNTSGLTLFPAVTNPLTRDASVLASAIQSLTLPRFDIPPAVHAIYPDLSHARDWEQAIAATSFVPDDVIAQLCETFGLVGTLDLRGRESGGAENGRYV